MPPQGKVVVVVSERRTRAKATLEVWKLVRVTMLSVSLETTVPMTRQLGSKSAKLNNEMLRS
jgi:hypothetical protein